MLDQGGLSARTIADQLGHSRISMTQNVYMGRRAVAGSVAFALERLFDPDEPDGGENGRGPLGVRIVALSPELERLLLSFVSVPSCFLAGYALLRAPGVSRVL